MKTLAQFVRSDAFLLLTFGSAIGLLLFVLTGGWGGVLG